MNNYAVGTQVTMQATFTDVASGNLVDPTTVECKVMAPSREISVCTANRSSLGIYTANFTTSEFGVHSFKFQGTGNCQASAFGSFAATGVFL